MQKAYYFNLQAASIKKFEFVHWLGCINKHITQKVRHHLNKIKLIIKHTKYYLHKIEFHEREI